MGISCLVFPVLVEAEEVFRVYSWVQKSIKFRLDKDQIVLKGYFLRIKKKLLQLSLHGQTTSNKSNSRPVSEDPSSLALMKED